MNTIHKVAAMVIQNDCFLMVRKHDKAIWTSLGGHIEQGETELHGAPTISDPELADFTYIPHDYVQQGYQLPDSITNKVIPYCVKNGLLDW